MPEGHQEWGPTRALHPTTETRSHEEDDEMMTPMTVNSLWPGRPIGGHWWLPNCLKKGSKG